MLPHLSSTQKSFIEITNPVHGGPGWELGTTLWSPVHNRGGRPGSWKLLKSISPGDFIIHLVTQHGEYHWTGISQASTHATEVLTEPPVPAAWAGMSPYQRISLEQYVTLETPQPITEFFERFKTELTEKSSEGESAFYVLYGDQSQLRVAQRYIANCPLWLYELFNILSDLVGFSPRASDAHTHIPTQNEPSHPDYSSPGRVPTTVSRIVRDTILSRELKREFSWRCQVCNTQVRLPGNNLYAEGHHLKPLGGDHCGPDVRENIIILCPNHHAEFDYGAIAIHPETRKLVHILPANAHNHSDLAYHRAELSREFIAYHFTELFGRTRPSTNDTDADVTN